MQRQFLVDEYVNVSPGEAIRVFKFGNITKGGKVRKITPELARRFNLPHFKPPIKLGSHADATPAGGHLTRLEVREDGLYGHTEFTDKGLKSLADGDFRYQSPEVIWEEGALENPNGGDPITGPLIVGMAMLHTPHMGEQAAVYEIEKVEAEPHSKGDNDMGDENVISLTAIEKLKEVFSIAPADAPEPETKVPEDYEAIKLEAETLKAEKADREKADKMSANLVAVRDEFSTKDFGEAYSSIAEDKEGVAILAEMPEAHRKWVMVQLKKLSKQADPNLEKEKGADGAGDTELGVTVLNKKIEAYQAEKGVAYPEAWEAIRASDPELFEYSKAGA